MIRIKNRKFIITMQKTWKIWAQWIAITLFVMGVVFEVYLCALGTQGLYSRKIADCTNNSVEGDMHFPSCHGFQIILDPGCDFKTRQDLTTSCVFSGNCFVFSNKTEIARFQISSGSAEICHGRKNHSSLVYRLAGFPGKDFQTNSPLQLLKAHDTYQVKLQFDYAPPKTSSIWLYWTGSIYSNMGI